MEPADVVIYDPNWINPYGLELSSVVASCGYKVDLWCDENRSVAPHAVRLRSRLAIGRKSGASVLTLLRRRALGPLETILSIRLSQPLIVVWIRDPWDAFLFCARALIGGKTIFIYHNPISSRRRHGFAGRIERILLRLSDICVVHSDRLAAAAVESTTKVRVAAHPPYRETTRSVENNGPHPRRPGEDPVVAFVGALRADKGADEILPIAASAASRWTLRVLGPDAIPPATAERLSKSGVTCEHVGSGTGPTDEELLDGLTTADVMIAPYNSVTESGSLHLALSLNLPVLGYESDGVRHIINGDSLAPNAEQFGRLLAAFFDRPWPTYTQQAAELHEKCKEDWNGLLNGIL